MKLGRRRKKSWEEMTGLERFREENERLKTENAFLERLRNCIVGERDRKAQIVSIIKELVNDGKRLDILLVYAGLACSTYYYHLKRLCSGDKNQDLKHRIQFIFHVHKENYGYRRITLELRKQGLCVNHKKVHRLMKTMGLAARVRRKQRYYSYKGEVGRTVVNLIKRQFKASKPYENCYTDITEFTIPASSKRLYLSTVLDGCNSEIIVYQLSTSPNLKLVKRMLNQAFPDDRYDNTILHSDQGWQYQHQSYHDFLNKRGILPSMSFKGSSYDNGMMEAFFSVLKSEMFYGFEKTFKSLEALKRAIIEYIDY